MHFSLSFIRLAWFELRDCLERVLQAFWTFRQGWQYVVSTHLKKCQISYQYFSTVANNIPSGKSAQAPGACKHTLPQIGKTDERSRYNGSVPLMCCDWCAVLTLLTMPSKRPL